MGYTTDFEGSFKLDKPLRPEHAQYLQAFSSTRRMRRDKEYVRDMLRNRTWSDPILAAVGLDLGAQAGYFVGGGGFAGQDRDLSILDYNSPPDGQPGLWCQWEPNEEGTEIQWNGSEKFYDYTEWLKYLIANFLGPWGYKLNGEVKWQGEASSDFGLLVVQDNDVSELKGRRTSPKSKAVTKSFKKLPSTPENVLVPSELIDNMRLGNISVEAFAAEVKNLQELQRK